GIILLYDRNVATAEELSRSGYRIVDEADLLLGREELDLATGKSVILLAAHELSRARGGPRCMAMPLVREPL
ncbi:MAG TPA: arginine deiminase family protein, partial [Thermoanaerobaculia bacterium]|nr:arginine deiminase family protein [Thermoanaerobaculia bacterium]